MGIGPGGLEGWGGGIGDGQGRLCPGWGARMPLGVSTREVSAARGTHGEDSSAGLGHGGMCDGVSRREGRTVGDGRIRPGARTSPAPLLPSTAAIFKSYFSIWSCNVTRRCPEPRRKEKSIL